MSKRSSSGSRKGTSAMINTLIDMHNMGSKKRNAASFNEAFEKHYKENYPDATDAEIGQKRKTLVDDHVWGNGQKLGGVTNANKLVNKTNTEQFNSFLKAEEDKRNPPQFFDAQSSAADETDTESTTEKKKKSKKKVTISEDEKKAQEDKVKEEKMRKALREQVEAQEAQEKAKKAQEAQEKAKKAQEDALKSQGGQTQPKKTAATTPIDPSTIDPEKDKKQEDQYKKIRRKNVGDIGDGDVKTQKKKLNTHVDPTVPLSDIRKALNRQKERLKLRPAKITYHHLGKSMAKEISQLI